MNAFYEGMAEIFEIEESEISPEFHLSSGEVAWDSLAIVSTIALADDCFDVMLDGKALGECITIADIENLIALAKKARHVT
jgi:acyl carrier protein